MQLLKLRRRLSIARRGHKLLKDKQDQLMRNFIALIEKLKGTRTELESEFLEILRAFTLASSSIPVCELKGALGLPGMSLGLRVSTSRLMNLRVPHFQLVEEGEPISYSYYSIPPTIDTAVIRMRRLFPKLVELAELEKRLTLLADEIDRTRRRVNALEYLLIPSLEETIKYIKMKLEEAERSNLTRLMRVKEIIEKKRETEQ